MLLSAGNTRQSRPPESKKKFPCRHFLSGNMLPFVSCCQILSWFLLGDVNADVNCEEFSVCILAIWQTIDCVARMTERVRSQA